jgi:hypothetical protein
MTSPPTVLAVGFAVEVKSIRKSTRTRLHEAGRNTEPKQSGRFLTGKYALLGSAPHRPPSLSSRTVSAAVLLLLGGVDVVVVENLRVPGAR